MMPLMVLPLAAGFHARGRHGGVGSQFGTTRRSASASASATEDSDDSDARSQFGTKLYWDEMYAGRGDFDSEEYCWYYGWDRIGPIWDDVAPEKTARVLLPGVGNDPTVRALYEKGWTNLYAFDYSEEAVNRQRELTWDLDLECEVGDARDLALDDDSFDAAFEKGALDAMYLAGDGNFEAAVRELGRVLKPGGVLVSVSGVVPPDVRAAALTTDAGWDWLRDGGADLQAGCFAFRRRAY